MRVRIDCLVDFEREGEGATSFFGRDERGGAGSYTIEERCDLKQEGFAVVHCNFLERQSR